MQDKKYMCPYCKIEMLKLYGCGGDYDRMLCPRIGCSAEIELETSSYPEETAVEGGIIE